MIYSKRGEEAWDKEQEKLQDKWRKERELKYNKYKCQMCEELYDNENSLKECIKEHQKTLIYLKAQVKSFEEIFENAVYRSLEKK